MTHILLLLIIKALLIHPISSQSELCLWGRVGFNYVINGVYTVQSNLHNGQPYYLKEAPDCKTFYMYWQQHWKWGPIWSINDMLGNTALHAFCNTSTIATDCTTWHVWDTETWNIDSNIQLSSGTCPTWPCDAITIPGAPNDCDSFDISLGNNVWKNSNTNRWWYFEPYYFEWMCAFKEPICGDTYYAFTTEGWVDLLKGESTAIQLDYPNSNTYTLNCIAHIPTVAPTKTPSKNPTSKAPTSRAPTTRTPSSRAPITNAPTTIPTTIPTVHLSLTDIVHSSLTDMDEGSVGNMNTTSITIMQTIGGKDNDSITSFWIIFIVFLILILTCITCLAVAFIYKYKKEQIKASDNIKNVMAVYSIDRHKDMQMGRDRVYTHSQYIDDDNKIDIDENNPETPKEENNTIVVMELEMEMIMNGSAVTETPGNISNIPSVNSEDIFNTQKITGELECAREGDETTSQKCAVKEWLENKVKLPQYYEAFIKNGYDSLDILVVITEKKELEEIGILLKGHKLKIMKEIKILRNVINGYVD